MPDELFGEVRSFHQPISLIKEQHSQKKKDGLEPQNGGLKREFSLFFSRVIFILFHPVSFRRIWHFPCFSNKGSST